ncbi:hypothetical protein ONE63_005095 [Megalurothrips usitatus]|uniref:Cytochrome P450 n=1 Tax=Megalurothrips usitatus TaxID=439358 RepID=A0AAV7XUX5_9NEOP|nr:hypothetical protein ONE63_005095 [Megalurothrips usitatus]
MALISVLLGGVAGLLGLFIVYFSWNFNYWHKRAVPSANPFSLFGDRGGGLPFGKSFWSLLDPVYKKYKGEHAFVGTFQARRPVLVALDPELIKTILTKEYSHFQGRGQAFDELEGPRWKALRSKLSPVFTSGKLKVMFPLMTDVGQKLDARLRVLAAEKGADGEVELRDLLVRYSTDIIASVAFGVTCDSLSGEANEFHTASREVFSANLLFIIRLFLSSIHPALVKLLPFTSLFNKASTFFLSLMKETVEFREKNKVDRNDLVKLMMQLREADSREAGTANYIGFNEKLMAAQAFVFFAAGLENNANGVGFALHELSINPELQQRAATEVRACSARHGGLTYEAVHEMELVERILREVLRKYCPVGTLTREPTTAFQNTDLVIDKSVWVWIPVWQLAHDPDFFPDPERFDPDRFTDQAREQRHPYAYLPFGEGPRFCVAERFAILEMKLCLAGLLDKFTFSVGRKTDLNLEFIPTAFSPTPKKGFWLKVDDRP